MLKETAGPLQDIVHFFKGIQVSEWTCLYHLYSSQYLMFIFKLMDSSLRDRLRNNPCALDSTAAKDRQRGGRCAKMPIESKVILFKLFSS